MTDAPPSSDGTKTGFPVVAIGASAGGLAALKELFSRVPAKSGAAYVVVVHLSPAYESVLDELLQPHVAMPVRQVSDVVELEIDHVYVISPNANLELVGTQLRSNPLEPNRHERAPIDHFFRTLASVHDGRAVGIVLSGTGSDGTLGLRQIKEHGGLTVVQDPCDAEYDGMPRSAIAAAPIDLVLPVREIPAAIMRFMHTKPVLPDPVNGRDAEREADRLLKSVFSLIRARTGRDFSAYKRSTLLRRIGRRMQFQHVEGAADYVGLLRQQPEEIYALADDLLITVTRFFRDPDVFAQLQQQIIPELFNRQDVSPNAGVRVWSVACATGEEAYSLAILLFEEAARRDLAAPFHLFATDLHRPSLEIAREGFYPSDIATDVSSERLARFFVPEDGGYRVRPEIRERVVFAPHNLLGDPPFSRIDLISCRNLLIYLRRELQQKVTELFHYALKPDGIVVLGTSEALDTEGLFRIIDKGHGIYRKRNVPVPEPRLPVFPMTQRRSPPSLESGLGGESLLDPIVLHRTMVDQLGPASVLVSPDDKIVHFSGRAGRYLLHPGGLPTTSVYRLVREELRIELRTAIPSARGQKAALSTNPVPVRFNGAPVGVVLHVHPAVEPGNEGFVLVFFEEHPTAFAEEGQTPVDEVSRQEEHELTQQRLQAIIKDYETSQEELRASNEELQSANEELRSTMEELETSKEELQSMNEELQTVNQENRHRVEELDQLSRDLQHLLAATDIATLFLDREQRIMRFTPGITSLFNLRGADRGRALADFSHRLGYERLHDDVASVLEHLVPIEREIQDEKGTWYLTRLLPYRSAEDRIGGVVITFLDITERHQSEHALRESEGRYRALAEMSLAAILVSHGGYYAYANSTAARLLGARVPEDVIGHSLFELFEPEDHGAVREHTRQVLEERRTTSRMEYRWRRLDGSPVDVEVIVGPIDWEGTLCVQVIARDITDRKRAEEAMRAIQEERYHTLFELIDEGFCIIEVLFDDHGRASDYRFLEVNPAFSKHTGLTNAPGRRARELVPQHEQRWLDVYGEVATTGTSVRFQQHAQALGRTFDIYALRVGKAWEHRVALLINDVTAQRQLEDHLRSTAEELSRASTRKDEYLAMLGHELRNPLAAVRSAVELIELIGQDDTRLASACAVLQRQSTHMSQLVDGLIDVARIAKGKVRLELELVEMGALLGLVIDDRASTLVRSGILLESSLPPGPVWVRGDRVRLVQVFDNLIGNAIKFTPAPGRITVALEREGELAVIRVRDSGVGLHPEVLTTIFEPFHQEPQDSARTSGGLGLGLALAKGLLELHRGSLEAHSEGIDTGAEFVVRLPVVSSPLTSAVAEPRSGPSYRILVVEDNVDAAEMLGQLLQLVGHQVELAHDGVSALETLRERRADVVICDLGLPGMTGHELARALRDDPSLHDLCLIALTGYGQPNDRQRALEAGFDEHLVKPVGLEALSAVLERMVHPRG